MSTYWGDMYLIRPSDGGWEEVFDSSYSFFLMAMELWQLAGKEERASAMRALFDRAFERRGEEGPVLHSSEIDEMVALLDGIEEALVGRVVDQHWLVPVDALPEIRRRCQSINVDERRGDLAIHGVSEAIAAAIALRNILLEANRRGLHVSLPS